MCALRTVQMSVLYILSILVILFQHTTCQMPNISLICLHIGCTAYKTNEDQCPLGYVGDPLTGECIPNCGRSCENQQCSYCFHSIMNISDPATLPKDHHVNVLNVEECDDHFCPAKVNSCIGNYVTHPYVNYQCIRPCDKDSCKYGWCLADACVCRTGYRPNPLNPRECTKFPEDVLNWLALLGSYKLGVRKPACDYDNTSNVMACECPESYKFRDGSFRCEFDLNDEARRSTRIRILRNMSFALTNKVVYDELLSYITIPILACANVILAAILIVLVLIMMKSKKNTPTPERQTEALYEECYYSIPKIEELQANQPDGKQLTWPHLTEEHLKQLREKIIPNKRYHC